MSNLRQLARNDGRFAPDAFHFLFEALDVTVKKEQPEEGSAEMGAIPQGESGPGGTVERHVTGQQVLQGLREHALDSFGPLAAHVWRSWGVNETLDWGHIVFLLVEAELLRRQEDDSIEDFRDGFDFDEAFVEGYRADLQKGTAGKGAASAEDPDG